MLRSGVPLLTKHVSRLCSVLVTIVSVAVAIVVVVGVAIAIFLSCVLVVGRGYLGLGARAGSLIQ